MKDRPPHFDAFWKSLRQIFEKRLFIGYDEDFEIFCQVVLELPKGEGTRFSEDPTHYTRKNSLADISPCDELPGTIPRSSPEQPPELYSMTRPLSVPQAQNLEHHPLAEMFPMLMVEEMQVLRDDIRKNGLVESIVLLGGKVLDGRNRYAACVLEGVEPRFEEFMGTNPVEFVMARNLHRRHLTPGQRAAIAVEFLPRFEAEAAERKRLLSGQRENPEIQEADTNVTEKIPERGEARAAAAKVTRSNPRYVSELARIKRETPEVYQQVLAGALTVPQAKRQAAKSSRVDPETETDAVGAQNKPFVVILQDDTDHTGDHHARLWKPMLKGNAYPIVAFFRFCRPGELSSLGGRHGFRQEAVFCVDDGASDLEFRDNLYQRPSCRFLSLSIRGKVPSPASMPDQCVVGGIEGAITLIKHMWPAAQAFFLSPAAELPLGWDVIKRSGRKSGHRVQP